jgi:hypothetical protein
MRISLLTDAPKHNLALMKLSAYHKDCGDVVTLNEPIIPADYTYASVLFDWNVKNLLLMNTVGQRSKTFLAIFRRFILPT